MLKKIIPAIVSAILITFAGVLFEALQMNFIAAFTDYLKEIIAVIIISIIIVSLLVFFIFQGYYNNKHRQLKKERDDYKNRFIELSNVDNEIKSARSILKYKEQMDDSSFKK